MGSRYLKRNMVSWAMYSVIGYIIMIPLQMWIPAISYALIIGLFAGMGNSIIIQLRMLNGEKFPYILEEDKKEDWSNVK
jgi:preprotein translocase subunit SecF